MKGTEHCDDCSSNHPPPTCELKTRPPADESGVPPQPPPCDHRWLLLTIDQEYVGDGSKAKYIAGFSFYCTKCLKIERRKP
jgi:hypothetical protein